VINPDKAQIKVGPFEMPMQNYTGGKYSFWNVFTSQTMVILYFSVTVILLAVYFFM
jgi:hypothetical protein